MENNNSIIGIKINKNKYFCKMYYDYKKISRFIYIRDKTEN